MVDMDQPMAVPRLVVFFVIDHFTGIYKGKSMRWRCVSMTRKEAVR
jgi:hypothetical protein